jgi:hypothetical protein
MAWAVCTPLHRDRTEWQTRIARNDGRLCALVTQTQVVLPAEKTQITYSQLAFVRGLLKVR